MLSSTVLSSPEKVISFKAHFALRPLFPKADSGHIFILMNVVIRATIRNAKRSFFAF